MPQLHGACNFFKLPKKVQAAHEKVTCGSHTMAHQSGPTLTLHGDTAYGLGKGVEVPMSSVYA
jgi:hypothetical protein